LPKWRILLKPRAERGNAGNAADSVTAVERHSEVQRRRIVDLVHGDETVEYGPVGHREGRKVWFEQTVVTFTSLDDEVIVARTGD